MPANNLHFTMVGTALGTVKSETGIELNTATLEVNLNQPLTPIEKTLSNCVLGS